jgi:hypothetical protein
MLMQLTHKKVRCMTFYLSECIFVPQTYQLWQDCLRSLFPQPESCVALWKTTDYHKMNKTPQINNLRWLDIVITKTLLKNRELKTGWPFLRPDRGNWLTKWKNFQNDLTWAVARAISRHCACSMAFYVNCWRH